MVQTAILYVLLLAGQFFALYHMIRGMRLRSLSRFMLSLGMLVASWYFLREVAEINEREIQGASAAEAGPHGTIALPPIAQ